MNFEEWQQNHEQILGLDITGICCSCGAREKNKCNKESTPIDGVRYGKMCVKELKEEGENVS